MRSRVLARLAMPLFLLGSTQAYPILAALHQPSAVSGIVQHGASVPGGAEERFERILSGTSGNSGVQGGGGNGPPEEEERFERILSGTSGNSGVQGGGGSQPPGEEE